MSESFGPLHHAGRIGNGIGREVNPADWERALTETRGLIKPEQKSDMEPSSKMILLKVFADGLNLLIGSRRLLLWRLFADA